MFNSVTPGLVKLDGQKRLPITFQVLLLRFSLRNPRAELDLGDFRSP